MAYAHRESLAPPDNPSPGHQNSYRHSPISSHVRGPRSASTNSTQTLSTPARPVPTPYHQDEMLSHAQEQQSIYGDPNSLRGMNDYDPDDYQNHNPRKRVNTDGNENPKKRAAVACNVCRGRKSKCDGARPKCRLCNELNTDCIYQEPGIKLDAGDRMILERLSRIEDILQGGWSGPQSAAGSMSLPPSRSATIVGTDGAPDDRSNGPQYGGYAARTAMMLPPSRVEEQVTLMRPLIQWPKITDLVTAPYDSQVLLQLELNNEPLSLDASLSLDLTNNAILAQAYFDNSNIWYACIDPYDWSSIYDKASRKDFRDGPESCLVLLVLALGAITHSHIPPTNARDSEFPGMPYFSAAWGLLPTLTVRHDIIASQCVVLASAYLCYLTRPLEAWTLLSTTIPKLQVLLSKPMTPAYLRSQLSTRIYWNALLLESSILVYLDLPASPLSNLTTAISLPAPFLPRTDTPPSHHDDPSILAALISIHRLNEKITIKTADPNATQGPIRDSLSTELRNLYTALPFQDLSVLPPTRRPLPHPTLEYLRTQYFLLSMRIYRPYILSVLTDESLNLHPLSLCRDTCRSCIEGAIRVMEDFPRMLTIAPWLKWQTSLAVVEAALMFMGVSRSSNLNLLILSVEEAGAALGVVIAELERLRPRAPSITRAVELLREADKRRQGGA